MYIDTAGSLHYSRSNAINCATETSKWEMCGDFTIPTFLSLYFDLRKEANKSCKLIITRFSDAFHFVISDKLFSLYLKTFTYELEDSHLRHVYNFKHATNIFLHNL